MNIIKEFAPSKSEASRITYFDIGQLLAFEVSKWKKATESKLNDQNCLISQKNSVIQSLENEIEKAVTKLNSKESEFKKEMSAKEANFL
jgi:hypothetical protein